MSSQQPKSRTLKICLDNPPPIVFRFCVGRQWDSRLIEYWTRTRYSHVEALVLENGNPIATFGAMLQGGVKFRALDDKQYREMEDYFTVHVPAPVNMRKSFWGFLLKQDGKPYDWSAIPSFSPALRIFVRDRNWRYDRAWICSELMAAASECCSLIIIPADNDSPIISIAPGDFRNMLAQVA